MKTNNKQITWAGKRFSFGEMAAIVLFSLSFLANMPLGSFLLDPFLLLISGSLIVLVCVRVLYKRSTYRGWITLFYLATIGTFYFWSVSLYFNKPYADWLWKLSVPFSIHPAKTGFNFMLTSGVLSSPYLSPEEAPFTTHMLAGYMFAFYPLWLWLGIQIGYMLHGRNEHQTGVIGALR